MPSFIRQFRLHRTAKESLVSCAVPHEEQGAITVLIGSNNSGKTYTLESLRHAMDTTKANKAQRVLELDFTGHDKPVFLYLGNNSQHMGKVGQGIDPFVRADKIGHPRDIPNYRPAAQILLLDMMEDHAEAGFRDRWNGATADERKSLLNIFPPVHRLFLCRQGHPTIAALQEMLGGTLYFRRANAGDQTLFEFLLTYDDAGPVPFGQWSDGQKMMFLAGLLLQSGGMDVVLIDEIENHLHPERITTFLSLIKRARVQGIISTHHPHVMFSEVVDRVYFVEQLCKPLLAPPKELIREKPHDSVIPQRRFVELRDDFARIEHLYRLFDQHDQQLLRLSSRIRAEVDLGLYEELARAFTHSAISASAAPRPDLQTGQLAKALRETAGDETNPVKILDLGAGLGRVAKELSKLSEFKDIEWECWEPQASTRDELKEQLGATSIRHRVLDHLNDVQDGSVAIALLSNVLHEITPEAIGQLLSLAARKIQRDNGRIIILELYPLLAVEYFAVPYERSDLTDILATSGFTFEAQSYSLRGRLTTATCIVAQPQRQIESDEIAQAVLGQWERMRRRSLGFWANKKGVRSFDDYKDILQHMTTIASISAHDARLWRTS